MISFFVRIRNLLKPRSFTFFVSRDEISIKGTEIFSEMRKLAETMSVAYAKPRTLRLTLPPISIDTSEDFDVDVALSVRWCSAGYSAGFRWINQPIHLSSTDRLESEKLNIISDLLAKNEYVFSSINVTSLDLVEKGSRLYAHLAKSLSRRDYRGFSNFRLGVGFNIGQYTPFFPFSDGPETSVSVALESFSFLKHGGISIKSIKNGA